MRAERDPEHAELTHLMSACELSDKDILEIGCGEGKFTVQYSGMTRRLMGVDPALEDLQIGRDKYAPHAFFIQAKAEQLPFPAGAFDIVIFASSL